METTVVWIVSNRHIVILLQCTGMNVARTYHDATAVSE